jgi:hypothetical protein
VTTAREHVHHQGCPDLGACRFIGGFGDSKHCEALDRTLDLVEEQRMHQTAEDLRRLARDPEMAVASEGPEHRTGWLMAAYRIDPYVQIPAFVPGSGASDPRLLHPDCTLCDKGREHWHRKADGRRVAVPDLPRPAFRGLSEIR